MISSLRKTILWLQNKTVWRSSVLNSWMSGTSMLVFSLGCILGLVSPAAHAAKQDPVTCSASMTGGINFGTVNVLTTANTDVTGSLDVQCQSNVRQNYYVTVCFNIGDGMNPSSAGNRVMLNGASPLSYQLYQDAARSQVWGSVSSTHYPNPVRLDFFLGARQTFTQTLPVYARLLGSQNTAATGFYQDSYVNPQVQITGVLTYSYGSGSCDQSGQDAGLFSSFNVTANVASNCLVSATNLNFGSASVLNTMVSSTSNVGVQCTNGTAYQIGLSAGQHAVGGNRNMSSGASLITYGLYQDAAHVQPWDSVANQKNGVGTGLTSNQTVFGLVPVQPSVPAGSYADTVQVIVSY